VPAISPLIKEEIFSVVKDFLITVDDFLLTLKAKRVG